MLDPRDPGHGPIQSEAESSVGDGAVSPEVEIPLKRLGRELVSGDLVLEHLQFVLPLPPADDLASVFNGGLLFLACMARD